ncbi:nucleotidyltransferase [Ancylomarina euxinus]|uniref:Nucleotidyltransferase n=1 Tax=Ancylomarina euxinus TaxID=2283627 RepID=A0A425Y732_9BACT|nr:sugar phosphate nucleotidyltransferase [Ancylomarina euxinus]MCZ4694038.1 sugar phosphate nucleotidyltransferase [Ancylomarina euxinus]MUP14542.1 nucleotidyltransferase [Ancylomarina euxinus]RRG24092.1 nucleotidyltransferase [Ancylomarina euxinus]
MKPTLLVLAAGMGSRYGGLKQIDPIGPSQETIIDYSIHDAIAAGFGKIVFVIREGFEKEFKELFDSKLAGKIEVGYVNQEIEKVPEGSSYNLDREKPWGTGHAILMAKECINEPFAVINADDYYGVEAFMTMADFLKNSISEQEYAMVGYKLANTISENGSVSRGVCSTNVIEHLETVVERIHIEKLSEGIAYKEDDKWIPLAGDTTVSMNFWGFKPQLFEHLEDQFRSFLAEAGQELKSEFFIPSVVAKIIDGGNTSVKVLKSDAQWFGVTYREDKEKAAKAILELVEQGVYPAKLWN